jgi:hypothetical protein
MQVQIELMNHKQTTLRFVPLIYPVHLLGTQMALCFQMLLTVYHLVDERGIITVVNITDIAGTEIMYTLHCASSLLGNC